MTLGADGSLWYAQDTIQGDYLVKLGDGCNEQVKLPIPTANATYDVTSLAFSTNGTLWFTEHAQANYSYPVGGAVGELAPGSASPLIVWSQSDRDDAAPTSLTAPVVRRYDRQQRRRGLTRIAVRRRRPARAVAARRGARPDALLAPPPARAHRSLLARRRVLR